MMLDEDSQGRANRDEFRTRSRLGGCAAVAVAEAEEAVAEAEG